MVAQNEVAIGRHCNLREGPGVGIFGRDVLLVERLPVGVYLSGIDADAITGHPDYPLDVALRWVPRIAEDDDIPSTNRFQAINELVDEDPFLIFQRRHHACA